MKSFAKILSLAVLPILCVGCKAPWHQTVKEANDELWENCGFLSFFQILGEKGMLNGFRDPRCDQNWLDYNECQYHSKYDYFSTKQDFSSLFEFAKGIDVKEIDKAEYTKESFAPVETGLWAELSFDSKAFHQLHFSLSHQVIWIAADRLYDYRVGMIYQIRYYRWGEGSQNALLKLLDALEKERTKEVVSVPVVR